MKAVSARKMDKCLTSKCKLEPHDGRRHRYYTLHIDAIPVPFPSVARMGRHRGNLPLREIKSIAKALGLDLRELGLLEQCPIGPICMYMCLFVRLLLHAQSEVDRSGGGTAPFAENLCAWLTSILDDLDIVARKPMNWNKHEAKALRRRRATLQTTRFSHPRLVRLAARLCSALT